MDQVALGQLKSEWMSGSSFVSCLSDASPPDLPPSTNKMVVPKSVLLLDEWLVVFCSRQATPPLCLEALKGKQE